MARIVVLGATGVFGKLLIRELRGDVVPAGRATGADMRDPDSIARLARGAFAVLCAAGPFQSFDRRCVRAVVEQGAHWLDIGDDPRWFFGLLDDPELDALARSKHVAVVPGLSSLPAISGALVRTLLGARTSRPQSLAVSAGDRSSSETLADCGRDVRAPRVDITLGIGNKNAKGAASIASAMTGDGRTIVTPDRELLRRDGIDARTFVKFQFPGAALVFKLAKRLNLEPETLSRISKPISRFGSDASYVEAVSANGTARVDARGQRLAILPIAILANRLIDGLPLEGVLPPHAAVEDLLDALSAAACSVGGTAS